MRLAVLVVESNATDQRVLGKYLEKLGYAVTAMVASAAEALLAAAANRLDLALVDAAVGGPGSGLEIAEALSDRFHIPVVLTGAGAEMDAIDRAKSMGATGFVVKPYLQAQLGTALELALASHRMERALERQRRWFHSLLAGLSEGVLATDADGRVTFANRAACTILGMDAGDVVEHSIGAVVRPLPERGGLVEDPLSATLRTGEEVRERLLRVRVGGEVRVLEANARRVDDQTPGRAGAMLVFRDVSERMRATEAMQLAAKMQSAGSLASGVAHHFNDSLQVVVGNAELIAAEAPPGSRIHKFAQEIIRKGNSSTALVTQLSRFSRGEHGSAPEPVPLGELVGELGTMIRTVLPATLGVKLPEQVPAAIVVVRRQELQSALLHLVENAREAMTRGGMLTFDVSLREPAQVVFTISDTGAGIAPEAQKHLFEPFHSSKGPGAGLGLASVLRTAQLHGGTVEHDSESGRGTTFRIVLPASRDLPKAPEAAEKPPPPAMLLGGSETILLTEDEETVRFLIEYALKDQGYHVLAAQNPAEALAMLESYPKHVHLLLTDIVMPGMDGVELAKRVRVVRPEIRVLFMSAYSPRTAHAFFKDGPQRAHLEKPFGMDDLARHVRRTLDDPNYEP